MRLKLVLLLLLAGLFSACSVTKYNTRQIVVANSGVLPKKMIAEMNVDITRKITGTGVVKNGSTDDAKDLAKWNAIQNAGADAIIDPVFKLTQNGSSITAEATGYYAEFVSIETATSDDIMTYIQVNIAGGTGILGISFDQYKAYYDYYFDKFEVEDQFRLTDDQLYYDYLDKRATAQRLQEQERKASRVTNSPSVGKILGITLLVTALSLAVGALAASAATGF